MRAVASLFLVVIVLGGCVALVYAFTGRVETIVQPIAFNHTVHLNEASLTCTDCHTDAATSSFAGLPGKDMCLDCHDIDEEGGVHAEKDKLFAFADTANDIPWRRIAVSGEDVYFSHRRHVTAAKLDCLECHQDQPTLSKPPPTARLVMAMDTCIECHENRGVTGDCLACHR